MARCLLPQGLRPLLPPPNTKSIAVKNAPALQQRQGFSTHLYELYDGIIKESIRKLASNDTEIASSARETLERVSASSKRIAGILGNSELTNLVQKIKAIKESQSSCPDLDLDVNFYKKTFRYFLDERIANRQPLNHDDSEAKSLFEKWNALAEEADRALKNIDMPKRENA